MSRPFIPPTLKTAVTNLERQSVDEKYMPAQFLDAAWAVLRGFYEEEGGEALLIEHGEFVQRSTAKGTTFYRIVKDVRPALRRVSERDLREHSLGLSGLKLPLLYASKLKQLRDTVDLALRVDGGLSDRTSRKLQVLVDETTKLLADSQNRCADGCRSFLDLLREGCASVTYVTLMTTILGQGAAKLLQAAATFLVMELENRLSCVDTEYHPPAEDKVFWPLSKTQNVFGFKSRKEMEYFLEKHRDSILTKRPLTKGGKPHPRRRNINIVTFLNAMRSDGLLEDQDRLDRIRESLNNRMEIVRQLNSATQKLFGAS
jgi:hypothetical protein